MKKMTKSVIVLVSCLLIFSCSHVAAKKDVAASDVKPGSRALAGDVVDGVDEIHFRNDRSIKIFPSGDAALSDGGRKGLADVDLESHRIHVHGGWGGSEADRGGEVQTVGHDVVAIYWDNGVIWDRLPTDGPNVPAIHFVGGSCKDGKGCSLKAFAGAERYADRGLLVKEDEATDKSKAVQIQFTRSEGQKGDEHKAHDRVQFQIVPTDSDANSTVWPAKDGSVECEGDGRVVGILWHDGSSWTRVEGGANNEAFVPVCRGDTPVCATISGNLHIQIEAGPDANVSCAYGLPGQSPTTSFGVTYDPSARRWVCADFNPDPSVRNYAVRITVNGHTIDTTPGEALNRPCR